MVMVKVETQFADSGIGLFASAVLMKVGDR